MPRAEGSPMMAPPHEESEESEDTSLRPPAPPVRRRRVACLHGTAANKAIFAIQCAPLRARAAKRGVDLIFFDAPKLVAASNPHAELMHKFFGKDQVLREFGPAKLNGRGWRTYEDPLEVAESAHEALLEACGGEEPDVLLGFSQGANMLSILAAKAEREGRPYRCLVALCGARPGWAAELPDLFFFRDGDSSSPLKTRLLCVRGESDAQVGPNVDAGLPDGPTEMAKLFRDVTLLTHPGGHSPFPGAAFGKAADHLAAKIVDFILEDDSNGGGGGVGDSADDPVTPVRLSGLSLDSSRDSGP